jgi:hypothetical protein
MPVLTDGKRAADVDNPKGYFEWEAIKRISKEPELLDDEAFDGRAIKCVSVLLPSLPTKHNYKVIFMTRPIEEIVRSLSAMLKRLNMQGAGLDHEQLRRGLSAHSEEMLKWITAASHIEFMVVEYPALITDPGPVIRSLINFVGADHLPSSEKMSLVIDRSLYHHGQNAA